MARTGIARKGETLTVELSLPQVATSISVMAEVVRLTPGPEWTRYGLRFVIVEPVQQEQLRAFVTSALEREGRGKRKHPRVSRRVDVVCRTADQFRAVMENISRGGLAIRCHTALVVDEVVIIDVSAQSAVGETLELSAQVMHVRTLDAGEFHVGLKFQPLPKEKMAALDALLARMVAGP